MKLRDYLKQFEGLDLDAEMYIQDPQHRNIVIEYNQRVKFVNVFERNSYSKYLSGLHSESPSSKGIVLG